jgi:hypothetical protein
MTWIEIVRAVGFGMVALSALRFCVSYHRLTRGTWRGNPYGVHMMLFSGAFVAYGAYVAVSLLFGAGDWRVFAGAGIAWSLAGLFWWRTSLLRTAQRERVTAEAEDAADYRGDHPPKA